MGIGRGGRRGKEGRGGEGMAMASVRETSPRYRKDLSGRMLRRTRERRSRKARGTQEDKVTDTNDKVYLRRTRECAR